MPETRRYEEAIKWVFSVATEELISRSGRARLIRIIVATGSAGDITIYDSGSASGNVVGVLDTAAISAYEYDLPLFTGLTLDKTGSAAVTVVYE